MIGKKINMRWINCAKISEAERSADKKSQER